MSATTTAPDGSIGRLGRRLRRQAVSAVGRFPSSTAALAEPPAGSGLRPVLGNPGAPLLGHTLNVTVDPLPFMRARTDAFGEVSWIGAFGRRCVLLTGPTGIETILSNRDRAFSAEEGWGFFGGPFFKRGILFMDFEEHLRHRRIMQRAFRRERMADYLEQMTPEIVDRVASWRPSPAFPLYPSAARLTLDIATKVFLGVPPSPRADELGRAFVDCLAGVQAVVRTDVPAGAWRRGLRGRRVLEAFIRSHLDDKRNGDGRDLISVLCRAESDEGERFTDDDVVNHMIFFLLAAHETTSISTSMLVYHLGRHPEWQERLRDEADALGTDRPTVAELGSSTATELAFRESLRMNAPVGLVARAALRDTEIDGRYVPSGTLVLGSLYASHRNAAWWSDPDRFDPERYLAERGEDRVHKYAWAPFGGHAHKCLGMAFGSMEVKAVLHQMLRRFTWSVPHGYEPEIMHGTGPLPADGLPIELRPRTRS
ncbi:MAG: cytochrome P450 [Solirubrobacteraceae bacterium]